MRKEKMLGSIGVSGLIILLGAFIICCPLINIYDLTFVFRLFLGGYAIVQLILFALLYKKKDYTNFFSFLVSITLLITSFLIDLVFVPKTFALTLLVWILVVTLVKLKKADYYQDRKSKVWCLEICILILFLFSGILTCISLNNSVETQILVLGYFILISGLLEVEEALLIYLTKGKLK